MRFTIHLRILQSVSTKGTRVERCVAISKENSAISLFNRDISHHFLLYHRGDWYCLRWEIMQYLDDVIIEGTVFIGSWRDFWKFHR